MSKTQQNIEKLYVFIKKLVVSKIIRGVRSILKRECPLFLKNEKNIGNLLYIFLIKN